MLSGKKNPCTYLFFWIGFSFTSKCRPDLFFPFCFSATPGPFDSPKGKACQKHLCYVDALDLKVSPPSPSPPLFLSLIHPCFHSSVVSHETYLQELGVSFSIIFFLYLASLGSTQLFITQLSQT